MDDLTRGSGGNPISTRPGCATCEEMIVYKVQYKEPSAAQYQDDGDWASCEDCVRRMRALFEADYRRDLRVIDDRGMVVASTDRSSPRPQPDSGKVAAPNPLTGSRP